jgi:thiamine-phosphate diphosphorylase
MTDPDLERRPQRSGLREALSVVVITDRNLAAPRPVEAVVEAALRGGALTIQLRDKSASAREFLDAARRLRSRTQAVGAYFIINDRFDIALACDADGVHVGPNDLPVSAIRRVVPAHFIIGCSTDDPEEARRAQADGADYIGCGTVYATATKTDAGDIIGISRLDEVARSVDIPVIGIGGILPERAVDVARTRAAGVAVIGAVMAAEDPEEVTRVLLKPFLARRAAEGTEGR